MWGEFVEIWEKAKNSEKSDNETVFVEISASTYMKLSEIVDSLSCDSEINTNGISVGNLANALLEHVADEYGVADEQSKVYSKTM